MAVLGCLIATIDHELVQCWYQGRRSCNTNFNWKFYWHHNTVGLLTQSSNCQQFFFRFYKLFVIVGQNTTTICLHLSLAILCSILLYPMWVLNQWAQHCLKNNVQWLLRVFMTVLSHAENESFSNPHTLKGKHWCLLIFHASAWPQKTKLTMIFLYTSFFGKLP